MVACQSYSKCRPPLDFLGGSIAAALSAPVFYTHTLYYSALVEITLVHFTYTMTGDTSSWWVCVVHKYPHIHHHPAYPTGCFHKRSFSAWPFCPTQAQNSGQLKYSRSFPTEEGTSPYGNSLSSDRFSFAHIFRAELFVRLPEKICLVVMLSTGIELKQCQLIDWLINRSSLASA